MLNIFTVDRKVKVFSIFFTAKAERLHVLSARIIGGKA
jgi:hypothetical protein